MKQLAALISQASLSVFLFTATTMQVAHGAVPVVEIGDNKVKLEVAQTREQIERGLMYRSSMPEDSGMVFLFNPPRPVRFWMYHCLMSLDMIFIKDGKIVKIANNVPPCKSQNPEECALYPDGGEILASEVVEVNAGYCKRHNIKEGDAVKFSMPLGTAGGGAAKKAD